MVDLGAPGGTGGFTLALITESFAVRALLGSLAAAGLAALTVRLRLVHGTRARRVLILAPVLTAAVAAGATAMQSTTYLPHLEIMQPSGAVTELRDIVGLGGSGNLLVGVYAAVASVLLARRLAGAVAVSRLVRRGQPSTDRRLSAAVARLAPVMGLAEPRLRLIPGCPGGAFAYGTLRPMVAVDPVLLVALDDGELEGLVAHELAHLRRRDGLLSLVIGVFRDVTFFVPAISLAVRWLRHEQEESADAVAARSTARPVALASGILKVWDRSSASGPRVACAAVPLRRSRLALAGAAPSPLVVSDGARLVAHRVELLLGGRKELSSAQRTAEVGLVAAVLAVALAVALTGPHWIAQRSGHAIEMAYLSAAAAEVPDESPAFASFRSLTRSPTPAGTTTADENMAEDMTGCPCVETQAQLRGGVVAQGPESDQELAWRPRDRSLLVPQGNARTLLAVEQRSFRVGVFLVDDEAR